MSYICTYTHIYVHVQTRLLVTLGSTACCPSAHCGFTASGPASLTSFYFHFLHQSFTDKHQAVILNVLTSLLCVSSQNVQMVFKRLFHVGRHWIYPHDLPLLVNKKCLFSNLTFLPHSVHFCCISLLILPKVNFEMKRSEYIADMKM